MSLPPIEYPGFTPEQLKLIMDTVARGATPDELKLFLYRSQNMKLDPLKPGMIHFVKYGNGPGTIVVGIDGFRTRAANTGKLSGIKRGAIRNEKDQLIGAWAEVYRADWAHPAREEVPLSEYNTGKGPWQKMPETMIKKVAEAAALRMAFPDELGGVYAAEEMDQATRSPVVPAQPEQTDGVVFDGGYRIPGGTFAKRKIEEVDPKQLQAYIGRGEQAIESGKRPKPIWWDEFVSRSEEYLAGLENGSSDDDEEEKDF